MPPPSKNSCCASESYFFDNFLMTIPIYTYIIGFFSLPFLEKIIVSLDIAHFSRVRRTNKGPILKEKSDFCALRGPNFAHWTHIH